MNIKLRLKNKATLLAIVATAVAFVYQVLGILGVAVPVSQDVVIQIAGIVINLLVGFGILIDPTTAGVGDSARAMQYEEPVQYTTPDADFPVGGENDALYEEEHEAEEPEED